MIKTTKEILEQPEFKYIPDKEWVDNDTFVKLYDSISGVNLHHYKKYHELEERLIKLEKKVSHLEQFAPMDTNGWD